MFAGSGANRRCKFDCNCRESHDFGALKSFTPWSHPSLLQAAFQATLRQAVKLTQSVPLSRLLCKSISFSLSSSLLRLWWKSLEGVQDFSQKMRRRGRIRGRLQAILCSFKQSSSKSLFCQHPCQHSCQHFSTFRSNGFSARLARMVTVRCNDLCSAGRLGL